MRFRRSLRIAPGVRLNVSKTGLSTSLGRRGFTLNLRGDRVRATTSIPGTGLSYTEDARSVGTAVGTVIVLIAILIAGFWLFA